MLKLFEPKTKVQKDRTIIRETDVRLAKYGRRGLITHFLVYVITIVFGPTFAKQHDVLAIVLTVGLLITTFVRGYMLFRFDSIYPRGPASWRNVFFFMSLAAAAWWSLILACVTLTTGISGEALLLWLYTIVFFATTSHAFAPYTKFLTIYQYLGLIPASLSVFFVGDHTAFLFGGILLYYVWILNHQSEAIGNNYWDNLEAQYVLAKKTQSMEEDKRDSRATIQLTNDYLNILNKELKAAVDKDEACLSFEALGSNLDQYYKILNKEFTQEKTVFNVRHFIQACVERQISKAEERQVFLESALSPALPMRLNGDPTLIGQIVSIMLDSAIQQTEKGVLFFEAEFIREYETHGELHVSLKRQLLGEKKSFFTESTDHSIEITLDLMIAKIVADSMGGAFDIGEFSQETQALHLRLPIGLADANAELAYHRLDYKAKDILLVNQNNRWLDQKRLELDTLGFEVAVENDYRKALDKVSAGSGQNACTVIFCHVLDDEASIQFSQTLLSNEKLRFSNQFIICSRKAKHQMLQALPQEAEGVVRFISAPAGIFEFDTALLPLYGPKLEQIEKTELTRMFNTVAWVSASKDADNASRLDSLGLPVKKIPDAKSLAKCLQKQTFGVVVCEGMGDQVAECVRIVREFGQEAGATHLPIIAIDHASLWESHYHAGVDHFCDGSRFVPEGLNDMLVWARGRFH